MKITECFMCIQVVERFADGTLKQWYDGTQLSTLAEAKQEKKANQKEYPSTSWAIIKRTIEEQ